MELLRLGGLLGYRCSCLVSLDLFFSFSRYSVLLLLVLFVLLFILIFLFNMVFGDGWDLSNNVVRLRQNGGHLEHLAGTLAIGGGDNRGVNVEETSLLEEKMSGKGQVVADTGDSTDGVSAGA